MLCEYFMEAGRNLGVEIKVKLIILKLFERYVLSDADQLYTEANQILIATGILLDLKPAPNRRAIDRAQASARADPVEAGNRCQHANRRQRAGSVRGVAGIAVPRAWQCRANAGDQCSGTADIHLRDLLRLPRTCSSTCRPRRCRTTSTCETSLSNC